MRYQCKLRPFNVTEHAQELNNQLKLLLTDKYLHKTR